MRELSLFTGGGGGVLATHHLLGWRTVGYVEWEEYAQRIIAARIKDGLLDAAPIYGDIRAFNRCGYAAAYTGMVDVITAGFPCQPFSVAGKQHGADDERNMWPATIATIRLVRPRYCLLENVPGLISNGYFATVLGDLAACGFDARWRVLSAAELGAPHKRDRLWIVAYQRDEDSNANGQKWSADQREPNSWADGRHNACRMGADVSDTDRSKQRRRDQSQRGSDQRTGQPARDGETWTLADTASNRCNEMEQPNSERAQGEGVRRKASSRSPGWWTTEPDVGRVANGVASRVDRLKALGNGQVPSVAATAWRLLTAGIFA